VGWPEELTVWLMLSSFTQVTTSPDLIVISFGLKPLLVIATNISHTSVDWVGVGAGLGWLGLEPKKYHPMAKTVKATIIRMYLDIALLYHPRQLYF